MHLVEIGTLVSKGACSLIDENSGSEPATSNEGSSLTSNGNVVSNSDDFDTVWRLAGSNISFTGETELKDITRVCLGDNENTAISWRQLWSSTEGNPLLTLCRQRHAGLQKRPVCCLVKRRCCRPAKRECELAE